MAFGTEYAEILSPEIVSRRLPLNSGDIYACGVLVFELLTGRSFEGEHSNPSTDRGSALEAWSIWDVANQRSRLARFQRS